VNLPEPLLRFGSIGLVAFAIGLAIYTILAGTNSRLHQWIREYTIELDKQCRLLYLKTTGVQIVQRQGAILVALLVASVFLREFYLLAVGVAVAIIPRLWLDSEIDKRKRQIEEQLDTFLVTLSNALKSSPSLGDALTTAANLMRAPIKEDLEFCLKEYKLGTPLDQALINMSRRIDSRSFNSALTTILIGRQTGGDLPTILDRSAATLRELARLEGVVRTKTAEGKSQAYVLGGVPFVVTVAINFVDPGWLRPLTTSFTGYLVMLAAAGMWVAAVFASRKILNVDV
jgi:tight adherence protein B